MVGGLRGDLAETYFENGQLQSRITFMFGEYQGPFEEYDEDGGLIDKGHYAMSEQCGEWIKGNGETVTYGYCPFPPVSYGSFVRQQERLTGTAERMRIFSRGMDGILRNPPGLADGN